MYNEVAATCTNTAGSYRCDCVRPFWDGDGTVSMLSTVHGAGISCAAVYGIPPSAPPSAPSPSPPQPPCPPSPPAAPTCPVLECGPGTLEDPITGMCEISCDDESRRRLGAASLEEEEVLALDEAGFLSSYLKEHPALAAMVDDELHALLLEVLADSKG